MAKIHRVGVSLLSESENDSGVGRDLKYNPTPPILHPSSIV